MFETLFSLKGKLKRLPYFLYTLVIQILAIFMSLFINGDGIAILPIIFLLFFNILFLILSAKRLRDIGVSGYFSIVFFLIMSQLGLTYHLEVTRIIMFIVYFSFWLTLSLYPSKKIDEEDEDNEENTIENS